MTAVPAKFTFDVDMARRQEKTSVFTDDKLAEMRNDAREEGRAEGLREGQQTAVARAAAAQQKAMEALLQQATLLLEQTDAIRLKATADATALGRAVAARLAPELVAREPRAELEALLGECMSSLNDAPHLVIRCHPDIADGLREAAEGRMATGGFAGRLVVMGEPDITLGDGRIEWADGGIVRDTGAIMKQIDDCIQSYLRAKGVPVAGETDK